MKLRAVDITCADIAYCDKKELELYKEMLFDEMKKYNPYHPTKYCKCKELYAIYSTKMSLAALRLKEFHP